MGGRMLRCYLHVGCVVGPVDVSITVGVSLCCLGVTLMWYHMGVVVIGSHGGILGRRPSKLSLEGDLWMLWACLLQ